MFSSFLLSPSFTCTCTRTFFYFYIKQQHFKILFFFRRMFWSNWHSSQPGIQRAYFSGFSAQFIVKTDISTPNGLAIDHKEQFLYWIDARLDRIERCDFDGNHRAVSLLDLNLNKMRLCDYSQLRMIHVQVSYL